MIKIIKSDVQPNPVEFKYWVDLSEDPTGSNVKFYNGSEWVSSGLSGDQSEELEQLEGEVNTLKEKVVPVTTSKDGLMISSDKSKLDGIAANANNYSHPTSAGNKHIPAGGSSGQVLKWKANGEAQWAADTDTKVTVENVLTSTQTANALSAAQGKVLKDALDALTARVEALESPAA